LATVSVTGWAQPANESSKKYRYEASMNLDFGTKIATIQAVEKYFSYQGLTQALGALLD